MGPCNAGQKTIDPRDGQAGTVVAETRSTLFQVKAGSSVSRRRYDMTRLALVLCFALGTPLLAQEAPAEWTSPVHANVRGPDYYQ